MSHLRFIPLAFALISASALIACTTDPAMPMGAAHHTHMAMPEQMAKMDMQMKTMREMRDKMMNASTPQDRSKLMAEHMQAMQGGMAMMGGTPGAGMGHMKGMSGMSGKSDDMGAHHQMMEKRMEMMQIMMSMMADRMPPNAGKQ